MLKRTPLRPKKNYTLKRTPLKAKSAGLKRSPMKKTFVTKEFVEKVLSLYNDNNMSSIEIAKELQCSPTTIIKIFKENGIFINKKDFEPLKIGEIYGNLKVLEFDHSDKQRGNFYLTECIHCHKQRITLATYIRRKKITCCFSNRGYSKTKLFKIWMSMRQRCNDKNCQSYEDYGARGIKVCDEWDNDFLSFQTWANNSGYKDGLSIERKDVNDGYNPKNCKWIPKKQQAVNKRDTVRFFSVNIAENIQKRNWRKVRQYGLILFSYLVRSRAKFKCELCGKKGCDAHHWYYTKAHNSITDIMSINGICLCRECHIKAHANFKEYQEKISKLKRFMCAPKILQKVVNLPIDFDHVEEIILRGRKELRKIYKENNFPLNKTIEELIKINRKQPEEDQQ